MVMKDEMKEWKCLLMFNQIIAEIRSTSDLWLHNQMYKNMLKQQLCANLQGTWGIFAKVPRRDFRGACELKRPNSSAELTIQNGCYLITVPQQHASIGITAKWPKAPNHGFRKSVQWELEAVKYCFNVWGNPSASWFFSFLQCPSWKVSTQIKFN